MEEWILFMKEELQKPQSSWDETDWDAYYYILSLENIEAE